MTSVPEFVAARLRAWGVDRAFGTLGPDVDPLIAALNGGRRAPEFVPVRHEESAALMACAHAKLTGRAGCCLAPSGPGALRLISGLYDAALDRQPVVAIIGEEPASPRAGDRRRAVSTADLFAHVSEYSERVTDPALLSDALDRVLRASLGARGAATLIVSRPVLDAKVPSEPRGEEATASPLHVHPPLRPLDEHVQHAADVLNDGRRVAVVVGPDAAGAAGRITEVAERLGAGVAKTPAGRDVLPDDLPFMTGVAAHFGSATAASLIRECDTLLLIGAHDFDVGLVSVSGEVRQVVTVDLDAGACPVDEKTAAVQVTGDVALTMETLLPRLRHRADRRWRHAVEQAVEEWRADGQVKARRFFGMAISPRSVVAELSARLPDQAIVVTDTGSALDWWSRHLHLRDGMRAILSRRLGTPGAAVPYAVAARLAFPERPVIALVGDGALQAGGMNELITVRRHLERIAALPPLIFCVLNNEDLSRLTWLRRQEAGDPRIPTTGEVPSVSYAQYAEVLGLPAVRSVRPGDVALAWTQALAAEGPVLLEFMVDGDTPPDWADTEDGPLAGQGLRHAIDTSSWRRRVTTSVSRRLGSG
ncbi:thiamine pyrophosphate-binding protein [Streptomyces sp. EMB24]|uniref:thiamine pyrophosphate-binding protein n=1 Tax=Streptomyces sp. EMB24 TaxID=2835531 RepID=UPI00227B3CCE|nr:thiamine pyrophosphate-binding protein [Streptomyces sp. EMB24]